jgi:hypothetical protein
MTTTYHDATVSLKPEQLRKLAHQDTVSLKHDSLEGDTIVCLTATQLKRLEKARATGKGMKLTFSKTQIAHCCNHTVGGGIWTNALRAVKKAVVSAVPHVAELVKGLVSHYAPKGVDLVSGALAQKLDQHIPAVLQPFIDKGIKIGAKFTKDQLEALIHGIKVGGGLYPPGY